MESGFWLPQGTADVSRPAYVPKSSVPTPADLQAVSDEHLRDSPNTSGPSLPLDPVACPDAEQVFSMKPDSIAAADSSNGTQVRLTGVASFPETLDSKNLAGAPTTPAESFPVGVPLSSAPDDTIKTDSNSGKAPTGFSNQGGQEQLMNGARAPGREGAGMCCSQQPASLTPASMTATVSTSRNSPNLHPLVQAVSTAVAAAALTHPQAGLPQSEPLSLSLSLGTKATRPAEIATRNQPQPRQLQGSSALATHSQRKGHPSFGSVVKGGRTSKYEDAPGERLQGGMALKGKGDGGSHAAVDPLLQFTRHGVMAAAVRASLETAAAARPKIEGRASASPAPPGCTPTRLAPVLFTTAASAASASAAAAAGARESPTSSNPLPLHPAAAAAFTFALNGRGPAEKPNPLPGAPRPSIAYLGNRPAVAPAGAAGAAGVGGGGRSQQQAWPGMLHHNTAMRPASSSPSHALSSLFYAPSSSSSAQHHRPLQIDHPISLSPSPFGAGATPHPHPGNGPLSAPSTKSLLPSLPTPATVPPSGGFVNGRTTTPAPNSSSFLPSRPNTPSPHLSLPPAGGMAIPSLLATVRAVATEAASRLVLEAKLRAELGERRARLAEAREEEMKGQAVLLASVLQQAAQKRTQDLETQLAQERARAADREARIRQLEQVVSGIKAPPRSALSLQQQPQLLCLRLPPELNAVGLKAGERGEGGGEGEAFIAGTEEERGRKRKGHAFDVQRKVRADKEEKVRKKRRKERGGRAVVEGRGKAVRKEKQRSKMLEQEEGGQGVARDGALKGSYADQEEAGMEEAESGPEESEREGRGEESEEETAERDNVLLLLAGMGAAEGARKAAWGKEVGRKRKNDTTVPREGLGHSLKTPSKRVKKMVVKGGKKRQAGEGIGRGDQEGDRGAGRDRASSLTLEESKGEGRHVSEEEWQVEKNWGGGAGTSGGKKALGMRAGEGERGRQEGSHADVELEEVEVQGEEDREDSDVEAKLGEGEIRSEEEEDEESEDEEEMRRLLLLQLAKMQRRKQNVVRRKSVRELAGTVEGDEGGEGARGRRKKGKTVAERGSKVLTTRGCKPIRGNNFEEVEERATGAAEEREDGEEGWGSREGGDEGEDEEGEEEDEKRGSEESHDKELTKGTGDMDAAGTVEGKRRRVKTPKAEEMLLMQAIKGLSRRGGLSRSSSGGREKGREGEEKGGRGRGIGRGVEKSKREGREKEWGGKRETTVGEAERGRKGKKEKGAAMGVVDKRSKVAENMEETGKRKKEAALDDEEEEEEAGGSKECERGEGVDTAEAEIDSTRDEPGKEISDRSGKSAVRATGPGGWKKLSVGQGGSGRKGSGGRGKGNKGRENGTSPARGRQSRRLMLGARQLVELASSKWGEPL